MPELKLTPVAVKVDFLAVEDHTVPDWAAVVRDFVTFIAQAVGQAPQQVIGHIKGMVRLPGYLLRVHCVSASVPVATAGELPADVRQITLELVLLVYGLETGPAVEAIAAAAARVRQAHGCTVRPESAGQPSAPSHTAVLP